MKTRAFMVGLILGLPTLGWTHTISSILEQAEQCREISSRLERLACFDQVFVTPLEKESVIPNPYPQEWQRAIAALALPNSEFGWVLDMDGEEQKSNAWIALPAQNRPDDEQIPPVLLLSCVNNLSRIELALPKEVVDARIQVSIRQQTQFWRSDDHGVLFSSARGMPAIEMMKSVASQPRLLLRSNAPFADGLQFDTRGLNDALDALRMRCGW